MLSVSHSAVLFFNAGIGIASIVLVTTSHDAVMAQMPAPSEQGQVGVKTMSQANVLFVNPSIGDDRMGKGGERTPLKTITQALRQAGPNTVIMLSKGTYSAETGEKFPLMLKRDVSIQGDSGNKGRDIVISGGGDYLSRTFGGKNVTIVGANQAGLTGVTVTNSNPRGYGLWIEYSSPVIVENSFIGSTQDGIAVTGNSQPSIRNNYFYGNKANGITITGNSRAQVRENVFQKTGFGINIAENAEPMVVGNQIRDNRCGILVQAHAHPIFRSNLIENSQEDGLVAIAQARPDLGSATEPGKNDFRNNTRYDINASASEQMIVAYGNTLTRFRINGKVETSGTVLPASIPTKPSSRQQVVSTASTTRDQPNTPQFNYMRVTSDTIEFTAPQRTVNQVASAPLQRASTQEQPFPVASAPLQRASTPEQSFSAPSAPLQRASTPQKPFPVASAPLQRTSTPEQSFSAPSAPLQRTSTPEQSFSAPSAPLQRTSTPEQSFSVPSAPLQRASTPQQSLPVLEAAPVGNTNLLPVPNSNVPRGNTSNMRKVPVYQSSAPVGYGRGSKQLATSAAQIDLRYRVLVEAGTQNEQQLVKFLAPNAFLTVWHGQGVMQVGVFSSRYNADNMVKILNKKGLRAVVEPIN
ncbi:MAG: DUF1565 domain-containing protein [Stigonema ocellatum SAG 48.90 = DSM 106950]|nr:DUF1565 domain-containing protein [Stigonema ocellatum SAG 48.90 = DSM 106950]